MRRFTPKGAAGALSPELERELRAKPWLGNVRELRNFVERALAMGATEALSLATGEGAAAPRVQSDAAPAINPRVLFKDFREAWIDYGEREYLRALLKHHGGNVSAAAQAAGLGRTYVYRLIKKHSL